MPWALRYRRRRSRFDHGQNFKAEGETIPCGMVNCKSYGMSRIRENLLPGSSTSFQQGEYAGSDLSLADFDGTEIWIWFHGKNGGPLRIQNPVSRLACQVRSQGRNSACILMATPDFGSSKA
jgi:hypothetical protein